MYVCMCVFLADSLSRSLTHLCRASQAVLPSVNVRGFNSIALTFDRHLGVAAGDNVDVRVRAAPMAVCLCACVCRGYKAMRRQAWKLTLSGLLEQQQLSDDLVEQRRGDQRQHLDPHHHQRARHLHRQQLHGACVCVCVCVCALFHVAYCDYKKKRTHARTHD
jgi:hypothetical protein